MRAGRQGGTSPQQPTQTAHSSQGEHLAPPAARPPAVRKWRSLHSAHTPGAEQRLLQRERQGEEQRRTSSCRRLLLTTACPFLSDTHPHQLRTPHSKHCPPDSR